MLLYLLLDGGPEPDLASSSTCAPFRFSDSQPSNLPNHVHDSNCPWHDSGSTSSWRSEKNASMAHGVPVALGEARFSGPPVVPQRAAY